MDTQTITTPIVKTTKNNEMVFIVPVPSGYALRIKRPTDKQFETIEISKDMTYLKSLLFKLFSNLN